jgi:phospholipid/cholesterol/gamma-HCH transport system substrate-binding protein
MRRTMLSREVLGLLVLLGAGTVLFLAVARPQLPWQEPYRVRAVVTSAETLAKGAPVRIAGVDVGKVEKVERGPGSLNTVTFVVREAGRPVHDDAQLKLRPRLFLEGNLFVDLRPGTPAAGELRSGGTIPVTQTAVPVRLDEVFSILRADTRDQVRTALDEYATALDGRTARSLNRSLPAWRPALASTAVVADAARGRRDGDLGRWVRDQGRAADAVAQREQDLRELIGGYATTMAVLGDRRTELAATIRGLARTARVAVPAARA